jgi:hypothetical protein
MQMKKCQLQCLNETSKLLGFFEVLWQSHRRLHRILKRRVHYLKNLAAQLNKSCTSAEHAAKPVQGIRLQAGDRVRIKSKEEIQATLNHWNQLKGCSFMDEMWPYCGTEQRILKRVEKFLDERDYLIKKCCGIVILDGVFCEGTRDFGSCDRTCFFFWREEWVEKIG